MLYLSSLLVPTKSLLTLGGSVTNADKTGLSFTSVEAARISQSEDIVQVLKSKHFVSVEATPTVLILKS